MTSGLRLSQSLGNHEVESVAIAALSVTGSPRTGGVDQEHLRLLSEAENKLPPIIVHRPTMRVIDGVHRVAAARERGEKMIDARFFDGDEADAFVLAVTSNMAHGLPLSMRDRTAAAARIIAAHPGWSDRVVASITGISARTVAEVRVQAGADAGPATRLGADGRVRPVDSTDGRTAAAEIIMRQPDLSLRRVARLAGISPETVRDVRNRLTNGQSPVRRGRICNGVPKPKESPAEQERFAGPRSACTGRLVRRLQSDQGFRESRGGAVLLRLFVAHAAEDERWDRLLNSIPAHCSGTVASLALECSRVWQELADRIERATEIA